MLARHLHLVRHAAESVAAIGTLDRAEALHCGLLLSSQQIRTLEILQVLILYTVPVRYFKTMDPSLQYLVPTTYSRT